MSVDPDLGRRIAYEACVQELMAPTQTGTLQGKPSTWKTPMTRDAAEARASTLMRIFAP